MLSCTTISARFPYCAVVSFSLLLHNGVYMMISLINLTYFVYWLENKVLKGNQWYNINKWFDQMTDNDATVWERVDMLEHVRYDMVLLLLLLLLLIVWMIEKTETDDQQRLSILIFLFVFRVNSILKPGSTKDWFLSWMFASPYHFSKLTRRNLLVFCIQVESNSCYSPFFQRS